MGQNSTIEWTHHTFNPWWGCTKVSPGCVHCYAETWASRYGHDVWGPRKERRTFSDNHWKEPLKWNKQAELEGSRKRVFCASMADVFEDHPSVREARNRLWDIIEETPMLDWLLLTKRPENMLRLSPWQSIWPENVWAMTSVENQEQAEKRIPILAKVPSVIRGLSVEPLIGPVDLRPWLKEVHWVIVGGESGAKARPMNPEWVYEIKRQCTEAKVPFFFKQWGEWAPVELENEGIEGMKRFGKKASGRLLEGRVWNEFPDAKKINAPLSRCPTPRAADPAGAGEELGAS